MNTKNTSADAESLQGGYGSPTTDDEMPPSTEASNDPLLEPVTPAGNDTGQVPVSESDLNKSRFPESPD